MQTDNNENNDVYKSYFNFQKTVEFLLQFYVKLFSPYV